jgi:short-subunit dehydrogenase
VNKLAAEEITIDVLVNNAGFGALGPFDQLDAARQVEMVEVNVAALTHLTRLVLPGMIERKKGGVINVGSTAGFQAGPYMAVYYATKAYVISFSEALHDELAGRGVKVTCLCPGPTATEFAAAAQLEKSRMFKMRPMTAAEVARIGYRAFRRGKLLVVTGWMNYLGTLGARYSPRFVARGIAKWLNT